MYSTLRWLSIKCPPSGMLDRRGVTNPPGRVQSVPDSPSGKVSKKLLLPINLREILEPACLTCLSIPGSFWKENA